MHRVRIKTPAIGSLNIRTMSQHIRCPASQSQIPVATTSPSVARPFDEMPGPKGPLRLGSILNYLPGPFQSYSWERLHEAGQAKYAEYGPIVREQMVPGVNVVWCFDPRDISAVLNDSGPGAYPQRTSHLALQKYRMDRPQVYRTGGLLPTNGAQWWRLRTELQKGLSSPVHVRRLLGETNAITGEFVRRVIDDRSTDVLDMLPELSRLNLELVCHLAFDVRLNSFDDAERRPESLSSRLIEAAETTNTCILPTDQGLQLWRLFETASYRRLRVAQTFMESVAVDFVRKKVQLMTERISSDVGPRSILEEYLANDRLDERDVVGMASDILLAGIDTTTYSSCFVLYHLARNPHVQQKLREEADKLLDGGELDAKRFVAETSYARAVLKESLRLNPIAIGVGRNLNSDLVLGGFRVPKGTVAVTQNLVACRLERNFADPQCFRPDRWLRGGEERDAIDPYLVLPFGHGMRACIARRLAEQSMLVLMLNLVHRYELDWAGSDRSMDIVTHLINKPDQPVLIRFRRREKTKSTTNTHLCNK